LHGNEDGCGKGKPQHALGELVRHDDDNPGLASHACNCKLDSTRSEGSRDAVSKRCRDPENGTGTQPLLPTPPGGQRRDDECYRRSPARGTPQQTDYERDVGRQERGERDDEKRHDYRIPHSFGAHESRTSLSAQPARRATRWVV
jgi:hypothetical protein